MWEDWSNSPQRDEYKDWDKKILFSSSAISFLRLTIRSNAAVKTTEDLADLLHELMCRHNHTDGCGWYYEIQDGHHNWTGSEHKRYLDRAIRMTKISSDIEHIAALMKACYDKL